MRDTFRSRQRKIMCFSALSTGRLIWLPELRGWLRLAMGEDVQKDTGRWKDRQRQREREEPLSMDASQGWFPEGRSPSPTAAWW